MTLRRAKAKGPTTGDGEISEHEISSTEAWMEAVRSDPGRFTDRRELAQAAGCDLETLEVLCRRHLHLAADNFLLRCRVQAVERGLRQGQVLDELTADAGFASPSQGRRAAQRHLRLDAESYGQLAQGHAKPRFRLTLPSNFRLPSLQRYLGRDPKSLYERIEPLGDGFIFRFACDGDPDDESNGGPIVVQATVRSAAATSQPTPRGPEAVLGLENPGAFAEVQLSGLGAQRPNAAFTAHRLLCRYLALHLDPGDFERRATAQPEIARLIEDRHGLSIPQTASLFDGLIWVVAGQQVSLAVAFALRRRLGRACAQRMDDDLWLPPRPAEVAALTPEVLRANSWSQRKTEYVLDLARAIDDGSLDLSRLASASAVRIEADLLACRGLGPWSVQYLLMRSFGLADCVPVGDAALKRNLKRIHGLDASPDVAQTLELMRPFAPHRSLATFHFWALES